MKRDINKKHVISNWGVVGACMLLNAIPFISNDQLRAEVNLGMIIGVVFSISIITAFFVKQSVPLYVETTDAYLSLCYLFGKVTRIPIKEIIDHHKIQSTIVNKIYTSTKTFDVHSFEGDVDFLDSVSYKNRLDIINNSFRFTFSTRRPFFLYVIGVIVFWGSLIWTLQAQSTMWAYALIAAVIFTVVVTIKNIQYRDTIITATQKSLKIYVHKEIEYGWDLFCDFRIRHNENRAIQSIELVYNNGGVIQIPERISDPVFLKTIVLANINKLKYE
ncbi:MAG: hypothetical protein OCD01_17495 [Fibrobacterales bacterium]